VAAGIVIGAAIGALYVGMGCAACGAAYVTVAGAAIGAPIVGMYAANSCWLNMLMGAGAEVDEPAAGNAETLPPAGIVMAGAGAGAV